MWNQTLVEAAESEAEQLNDEDRISRLPLYGSFIGRQRKTSIGRQRKSSTGTLLIDYKNSLFEGFEQDKSRRQQLAYIKRNKTTSSPSPQK